MLGQPFHAGSGSPTSVTDAMAPLLDDHALARAVLTAMERVARRAQVGTPLDTGFWTKVTAFFDDYFDAVHHPKEELLLLPMLQNAGFAAPHSPVSRMCQEHEQMLPYRQHLHFAIAHRDPAALRATVHAFTLLHRRHMTLEEAHVFPMARAVLGSVTQHDLLRAFESLDRGGAARERDRARDLVSEIHRIAEPDVDDAAP